MCKWRGGAFLLCVLLIGVGLQAQEPPFILRVDTAVVSVDAIVRDANERPVTNLGRKDFEIYEDGQQQELAYFATADTSRSLLLLFDTSGSTEDQVPFMLQSVNIFLTTLR